MLHAHSNLKTLIKCTARSSITIIYSCLRNEWYRADNVRRNSMPITPKGQRLIFLKIHFLPAGFLFSLNNSMRKFVLIWWILSSVGCWNRPVLILNILNVLFFLVMLRAWRERDQEKRIKTAHQALEHNAKYVSWKDCFQFLGKSVNSQTMIVNSSL